MTSKKLNISPQAFLNGSRKFFDAATVVYQSDGWSVGTTQEPVYALLFHSVELALKAYLLFSGVSALELGSKKYGHDVGRLLDEALRLGLAPDGQLAKDLPSVVSSINQANRSHGFRYLDHIQSIPHPSWVQRVTRGLLNLVELRIGYQRTAPGVAVSVCFVWSPNPDDVDWNPEAEVRASPPLNGRE